MASITLAQLQETLAPLVAGLAVLNATVEVLNDKVASRQRRNDSVHGEPTEVPDGYTRAISLH